MINIIRQQQTLTPSVRFILGITFTFFIALMGYYLAMVPGFALTGQLASAIFISIIYRQIAGYPEWLRAGITFSSKKLLRFAIILYGIKLNVSLILQDGLPILLLGAAVIAFALLSSVWLSKAINANRSITLLVGAGTGICGAAAIAAVAPIVEAKEEDTAIGVGIIALFGTIFSVGYTIVLPFLPLTSAEYGIWSGISLHEVAHVALAAAPGGETALAMGLLAKLGRVFLLVPVCFLFMYIVKKKNTGSKQQVPFPWFLVGFILMSLAGTYILGPVIPFSETAMTAVTEVTTWCLTAAMVGLGLSVSLKDLKNKALKPMAIITIVSLTLSILTFFIVKWFY
ncbi:YeiH family protein [Pseudalkalibacillus hwajinpoensis]|uniref:Putative sulfate exporter family transporter n=1 Tax=Guptibacillus hwajinpoensis TaxID=208199 RepID=A0A4U1MLH6_9BACL|nr:putative sulfate exporter family transporter [Pseudalkalibacillus hwajinpoensis]TKD71392.1 putative sulfate exporter family transporter [Pseudalkalibacillus hwajinpoensis]